MTGSHFDRQTERIAWIDIAKGIAILLVILGHTVDNATFGNAVIRGVIFSFHMPLFFILSCTTFKLSTDSNQFVNKAEKAFCHLIIPAIVLYGLRSILKLIQNFDSIEWKSYLTEQINIFVFGSGVKVNVMGVYVPAIGMPWFLMALFLGRSLFDYLHLKLKNKQFDMAIIICTLAGVAIGKLQWLPFSFDIALAIMPFFYFGNYLKTVNMKNRSLQYGSISLGIWVCTLILCYFVKQSYMELACRRYTLFPICYATAITATMSIGYFSTIVERLKFMKLFMYLGKNSMYMLWVHIMDYTVRFIWKITSNNFTNAIIRISVDVVLFVLLMQIIALVNNKKQIYKNKP